jgi:5'-methylthioinosine phosphorylase
LSWHIRGQKRVTHIAIIGGSGLDALDALEEVREIRSITSYGQPSGSIFQGRLENTELYFLARHGNAHMIPPHRINYRANIAALADLGVTDILAITAVGGISPTTPPRKIVIPDQIIDYTYGREHTFSDGLEGAVAHIDFTLPFTESIRQELILAAATSGINIERDGVYGATQGPRLETAAEISRMVVDGCTIVGMTGMPEAGLAREAKLNYANCSLVVNWAAGCGTGIIDLLEIEQHLHMGIAEVLTLAKSWLARHRS